MVPPVGTSFFRSFRASNASFAARASANRLACDVRDAAARAQFSVSSDWQVTDLFNLAEREPGVVFSDELLDETAGELIGPAYRVEEPDEGRDADVVMQAADARMRGQSLQPLIPILRDMLRDPGIQRSTMDFLRRNAEFQKFITGPPAPAMAAPLPIEWHSNDTEPVNVDQGSLSGLLEDLGAKMMAAGQAALQTAVGVRDALGRLLIHLGASLHAFLGRPFTKDPLEEGDSKEDMDDKAEIVGQALVTVALAILSIVLLKRVHAVAL